mgnify:FL=1
MKKNLSMILIKKISRSGVKNAPLFSKFGIKKYLPEGKMGFRAFALNSEKGVKTPRWRILGSKYATLFGANKLLWIFVLRFASTNIFLFIKWGGCYAW